MWSAAGWNRQDDSGSNPHIPINADFQALELVCTRERIGVRFQIINVLPL